MNGEFGLAVTSAVENIEVFDLCIEEIPCKSPNDRPVVKHTSDVAILLQTKKYEQLVSADTLRMYIERFQNRRGRSVDLTGVSDADLMAYASSRRIQSLSDLHKYGANLARNAIFLKNLTKK